MVGALGFDNTSDFTPRHIMRRINVGQVKSLDEIYQYCVPGQFLQNNIPEKYRIAWDIADPEKFN